MRYGEPPGRDPDDFGYDDGGRVRRRERLRIAPRSRRRARPPRPRPHPGRRRAPRPEPARPSRGGAWYVGPGDSRRYGRAPVPYGREHTYDYHLGDRYGYGPDFYAGEARVRRWRRRERPIRRPPDR